MSKHCDSSIIPGYRTPRGVPFLGFSHFLLPGAHTHILSHPSLTICSGVDTPPHSHTHNTPTFYIFSHFPPPPPPHHPTTPRTFLPFWYFLTSSFITCLSTFCLPVCQHQSSPVEIHPINVSCTSALTAPSSNRALLMCSGASTPLRYSR